MEPEGVGVLDGNEFYGVLKEIRKIFYLIF